MRLIHLFPTGDVSDGRCLIEVRQGGALLGWISQEVQAGLYRYFPGADNRVAFVFEHRDLAVLYHMISTRNWASDGESRAWAELKHTAGRIPDLDVWGDENHAL
jgi:hypothetical protein